MRGSSSNGSGRSGRGTWFDRARHGGKSRARRVGPPRFIGWYGPGTALWGRELLFSGRTRIRPARAREKTAVQGDTSQSLQGRPDLVRSRALRGVWHWSAVLAATLAFLALRAPSWTGDPLAALLPGVPAASLLLLFLAGRRPAIRRGAMVLATTVAGFLALATVSSLGAISLLGTDQGPGVTLQLACLGASALFLARSAPAWRRVNAEGGQADDLLRMYDEL